LKSSDSSDLNSFDIEERKVVKRSVIKYKEEMINVKNYYSRFTDNLDEI